MHTRIHRRTRLLGNIPFILACALMMGAAGSLGWLVLRALYPTTASWVAGMGALGMVALVMAWLLPYMQMES